MKTANRTTTTLALAGALVLSGGVASATSQAPAKASAHITSVTFTGSVKHPTIRIIGSGFGNRPRPNLPIAPYQAGKKYQSRCSTQKVAGNGKDGHDYSAHSLGVGWAKKAPHGYGAGVYVPGSYLDCIGLKIVAYTATKVVLRPGCQYALYPPIKIGDKALVSVNGAKARLTVAYHH